MWAYLARLPGPRRAARSRGCTTRARAQLLQQRALRRLPPRVPVRPSRTRAATSSSTRSKGSADRSTTSGRCCASVMRTARMVAVHNPRVAADLRDEYPGARDRDDSAGRTRRRPAPDAARRASACARRSAFRTTRCCSRRSARSPRRNGSARSCARSRRSSRERADVHLLLVGDASDYPALGRGDGIAGHRATRARHRLSSRTRRSATTSRRPTRASACAGRRRWKPRRRGCTAWRRRGRRSSATSRTWSTSRRVDPRGWQPSPCGSGPVAIAIDLLDEDESLRLAMRGWRRTRSCATRSARAGHAYWSAHHTLDAMADDYRRLIALAAGRVRRRRPRICRRISPRITAAWRAPSRRNSASISPMFWAHSARN